MNGYVDHVAKVGLLHIFVCFVRFPFPLVVVARLQHQLGMKGRMQLLRSIPAVVVPHKRQFSLKRFLSVKDSTVRSPRWLTTTKESMNHSVASFVSPRLIEAYALSLLAASDARKLYPRPVSREEIYDLVRVISSRDCVGATPAGQLMERLLEVTVSADGAITLALKGVRTMSAS